MKIAYKRSSLFVSAFAVMGVLLLCVAQMSAQRTGGGTGENSSATFNPPPCDYSNTFYQDTGLDPTQIQGRFGTNRRNRRHGVRRFLAVRPWGTPGK